MRLHQRKGGFTLVELITVIAVIALVIGVAGMGLRGVMASGRVLASAHQFAAELALARQLASTRNTPVLLRFVRAPDEITRELRWIGWQLFADGSEPGAKELPLPLSEPHHLEGDVVIIDDAELSTLLDPDLDASTRGDPVELRIQPDGSLLLPRRAGHVWCVTFANEQATREPGAIPKDSRTVVLNPFTAATRVY